MTMTPDLYRDLGWLPCPPADLRERLRAQESGSAAPGAALRALAGHALDLNGLARLGRFVGKALREGRSLAPLQPFRLGVLGNGTLDLLGPALVGTAVRHGFALDLVMGTYDQALQEAIAPDSAVNAARPHAVLLAFNWQGLPLRPVPGNAAAAEVMVAEALDHFDRIRGGIAANSGAFCILPTIAPPPESLFGSLDCALPGTLRSMIAQVNQGLAERALGSADVLLDVAGLAATVGLGAWHDPTQWNLAKLPFAPGFIPLYADHVLRVISATRGRSRRVLVLDLDNTLWGGVIGDDGLAGIRLAQGDAIGEAHLAVQRLALDLRNRGIVLAVCSKNTDAVAREAFRSHPEMLLREDHIAVFQANWSDKATNIKAIADELALGLDSMVFLDDNPVERGLIRQALPEVAVPELTEDPAGYARTLTAAGYFELTTFSAEDRQRAEFYQMNARRVALRGQVGDLDAYLASLNMEIVFSPFDGTGRARIAQLISKSNQFNLTTRRYSEAEVQAAEADPACFTLQVRLVDRFGDNGMISVVICRDAGEARWEIDTWLMSCRVLGRGVERMVLREILHHARSQGIQTLIGIYRPSERNAMVRDHYAGLGFVLVAETTDGEARWQLPTSAEIAEAPMTIRRIGFVAEPAV